MKMGCFDLKSESDAVLQEILQYKWLESEKQGCDIGINTAARQWISDHYDEWFRFNCQRYQSGD